MIFQSGNFPVNSQEILQNILDFTYSVIYGLPISPSGPSNVTENDVTFYLFNQTFKDEPLILSEENLNTLSKNKKLVIIIHGYIENGLKFSYVGIKDAYLEKNDYNVILADWQEPASKVYSVSAANTRFIGNIIAGRVIKSKVPLEQIHIVGHSLGAQVSGFAGKEIKRLTNGSKIGRITGIDPAGPLFEGASTLNRLHKEDALFVDIIHTDGGKFGIVENVGHVDFYPNGGRALQPGCKEIPEIPENVDEFISTGDSFTPII